MGLINLFGVMGKAINSTLSDQWLECFYAPAIANDLIMVNGIKMDRNGRNKGMDNVISNGSKIIVNEGQCMLIVDQGKIIDFSAEPGEYIYDMGSSPSFFCGPLKNLGGIFQTMGERIGAGSETAKNQKVYYIRLTEMLGDSFGSSQPMMYDDPFYQSVVYIRYFGEYKIKVSDPLTFYKNVAGNVQTTYSRTELLKLLGSEFISSFDQALSRCSTDGFKFSQLPHKQNELAEYMNNVLDEKWVKLRGITITSVGINKITPDDESRKMISDFDKANRYSNAQFAAGRMVDASAESMQSAAGNENGSMMGFMGLGMTQNAGNNMINPFVTNGSFNTDVPNQQQFGQTNIPITNGWNCSCGKKNIQGKFCPECGTVRPVQASVVNNTWKCSCGIENLGKFCSECGSQKPKTAIQYQCDKCGWTPTDTSKPPKFCPECGDPFNNNDIAK